MRRGIALITTLMMTGLLALMITSVVRAVHGGTSITKNYHDQVAALYVAEAGLADVMSRLEIDGTWVDGFNKERMPHRPGTYTVRFNTSGTDFEPWHSVNNIAGLTAADGPRGPGSVAPGTAYVVVVARVGAVDRQLEAFLNSTGVINVEYPLMTSRTIDLRGEVEITGLKNLRSYERVAAGIHSNGRGHDGEPTIKWRKRHWGDEALITGKVSAVHSGSDAIDFGNDPDDYDVGAFEDNAARRAFPQLGNIEFAVAQKSSAAPPVLEPGGTTSLAAGEFYSGGTLDVQGDLVLNGSDLYIDGDLNVNGGISGSGAVWVSGTVNFKGDSTLRSSGKAALMSRKGVNLIGFDGNEYMEDFADSDPEVEALWEATRTALGTLQDEMESGEPETLVGSGGTLDLLARELGEHPENLPPIDPPTTPEDVLVGGDYLGKLVERLEARSESSARDFMIDKLNGYRSFFSATEDTEDADVAEQFDDDPWTRPGAFDAVIDSGRADLIAPLLTQVSSVSYDKLGSSYFQGIIYTNGHVFAANNVTALGSIMADGRGNEPQPHPLNPSKELYPGELVMTGGANLTFIEEFFQDNVNALRIKGPVRIRTWTTR